MNNKTHIFEIPGNLSSYNEMTKENRRSIRKGNELTQTNIQNVYWSAKQAKLKPITKKIDIKITWICKDKRTDKDNVAAAIKYILDGLQHANVIKNDGWEEIGSISHHYEVDKENPRIIIELIEIGEWGS